MHTKHNHNSQIAEPNNVFDFKSLLKALDEDLSTQLPPLSSPPSPPPPLPPSPLFLRPISPGIPLPLIHHSGTGIGFTSLDCLSLFRKSQQDEYQKAAEKTFGRQNQNPEDGLCSTTTKAVINSVLEQQPTNSIPTTIETITPPNLYSYSKRDPELVNLLELPLIPNDKKEYLYVLKCVNGKWYVGKTYDLDVRYTQHMQKHYDFMTLEKAPNKQNSSLKEISARYKGNSLEIIHLNLRRKWTAVHGPCEVAYYRSYFPFAEELITLIMMQKFGIDNVRGGKYTFMELTVEQKKEIGKSIEHEVGGCFICGEIGHFANVCETKKILNASSNSLPTYRHNPKSTNNNNSSSKNTRKSYEPKNKKCIRCGRNNHTSEDCFAYSHWNGTHLGKKTSK